MERIFVSQSAQTTFWGRNKTRLRLWEEHIKDPSVALDSFEVRGKSVSWLTVGSRTFGEGSGMVPKVWDKTAVEGVWPYLDLWDNVRLRTASVEWNVPGKYGPPGELFFSFLNREPTVISELVEFGPLHVSRNSESMCIDRSAYDG